MFCRIAMWRCLASALVLAAKIRPGSCGWARNFTDGRLVVALGDWRALYPELASAVPTDVVAAALLEGAA